MVRQDSIGSMCQQLPQATITMQEDEYESVLFLQKHVYSTHKKVQRDSGVVVVTVYKKLGSYYLQTARERQSWRPRCRVRNPGRLRRRFGGAAWTPGCCGGGVASGPR